MLKSLGLIYSFLRWNLFYRISSNSFHKEKYAETKRVSIWIIILFKNVSMAQKDKLKFSLINKQEIKSDSKPVHNTLAQLLRLMI